MNSFFSNKKNSGLLFFFALSFLACIGSAKAIGTYPSIDPNMVLYYHFNNNSTIGENSTQVNDSTGNNWIGNITDATFNATGGILGDGDYIFNGSAYISVGTNFNFITDFSQCLWVKPKEIGRLQYISSKYPSGTPELTMYYDSSNKYAIQVRNSTSTVTAAETSGSAIVGKWAFICGTYNATSGSVRLYVDGIVKGSPGGTVLGNLSSSAVFRIGARSNLASSVYLNASLDEFIVWNKTLQPSEIWSTYQNYLECITPYEDINLPFSTKLCAGTYNLNDTAGDGSIDVIATADSVIDCNGAILNGNSTYGSIGMVFTVTSRNLTVKNCQISNYSFGLRTTTSNYSAYYNNTFINNINISLELRRISHSIVYNNSIRDMYNITSTKGLIIANYGSQMSINTSIHSNYFDATYDAITIDVGANYTRIYNNTINNSKNYGIHMDNDVFYNSIFNNTIDNTYWDGMQLRGAYSNISYNRINNSGHHGIDFYSATWPQYNIFEYNVVGGTNRPESNPYSHYIYLYRAQGNIIRYNNMSGGTAGIGSGIVIQGTSTNISKDNQIYGNIFNNISAYKIAISDAINNSFYNNTWINYNQNGTFSEFAFEGDAYNTSINDTNVTFYTNGLFDGFYNSSSETRYVNSNVANNSSLLFSSLRNALIYDSNLSPYCNNLLACISPINVTSYPGNLTTILNNYNITQGFSRSFDPISVSSSSSNVRSLTSTLTSTLTNVSITISTEGVVPSSPFVVYPNGSTFYITDYVYDSSSGTFAYNDSVPPGSSYLHLNSVDPTVYDICSSGQGSLFELSNWLSIFGLLVGTLFVLGVLSSFGFVNLNIPTEFFTIDNLAGIGLMLVGAAITISVGAQIIASALC